MYPLSEETACAFAGQNTTHIALIGPAKDYLEAIKTELSSRFPGLTVLAQQSDITSSESLGRASHVIRTQLGAWDVFIHNPSSHAARCPDTTIRGADEDLWWGSFLRNVRSLHFIARHFFPKMKPAATFINIVRTDLDGSGVERDSAGNASGIAAAKVVEYLGEENDEGLKVMNLVAMPEDTMVADFVVWSVSQRLAFEHGMHLDASIGRAGYEVVNGKLWRCEIPEEDGFVNGD